VLLGFGNHLAWIGIEKTEGTWWLVNNEGLVGYTNWNHGEPNNLGGNENCGDILRDGTWNDLRCNYTNFYYFVCETDAATATTETSAQETHPAVQTSIGSGKFHLVSFSFLSVRTKATN
jgi:hypothetical protein